MSNDCCYCSSTNNINETCPVCHGKGQAVKSITVQNMIDNKLFADIDVNRDFSICINPSCDVAYFDNKGNLFNQKDVIVPIWFKEGATPKYICYCNKVTEEDIVEAVTIKGAITLKQVIDFTGAMKNGNCLTNNPTGNCCHEQVKNAFELAPKKIQTIAFYCTFL